MNIPQGYKHTELGIIPKDWEVISIKERGCLVKDGINPMLSPNVSFWEYSMPAFDNGKQPTLSLGEEMHSNRTIIRDTVLLFNKLNVRQQRVWFVESPSGNSVCSMEFLPYVSKSINLKFLYHYLKTDVVTDYFNGISKGTSNSQKRITPQDFLDYKVILPPIAEQREIAEALSDVDGLIAALDKKIAKKRLLKQGAMQQLLTGKKRLPGFTDEWVEITFGDYVDIYRGGSPRPIENYITDNPNGVNWIKIGDVKPNDKYINKTEERIIPDGVSRSRRVDVGDFILSNSMSFGRPYILGIDGCIHDGWLVIQNYHNTFDKDYLYYLLCSEDVMMQYMGMAAGSSVKNLNKEKVASLQLCMPTTIKEQQAIATILSDMDKEIADLEAQRDKFRLLKSGMMQKLLTGQIRLVKQQAKIVPLGVEVPVVREIPVATHIIAGHIVNRSHKSRGWGRTKLQKSLHLIGYCMQLNLGNEYIRNTAGPDDQQLMNYIDQKFRQYRHVNKVCEKLPNGKTHYSYTPKPMIQDVEMAYEKYPKELREQVDALIDWLNTMDLAGAEMLSTLYAVWNNRIIKREQITDDLLIADFYAWSAHKADFEEARVRKTLNYMRDNNIIPVGWGKYIDKS